ncbi:MAG: sugar ABC transporter ATP-binding protein [Aggregatilineales bacterium]
MNETLGPPLLSVRRASKAYNGIPALIDAALDLYAGEVHALMGENGAGKSTLIKLLAGVLEADSIEIQLDGQPIAIETPADAAEYGFRFIHQELNIVPSLSVAENMYLSHPYPKRLGVLVDWERLHEQARAVLGELGISEIAPNTIAARLSPGDQMLVKIAGALVHTGREPKVYIMDEPTAALTGEEANRLFAVIERLCARGCAVLYVSHRMDEIFHIADRVTVMRDGRVVATERIAETSAAALIEQMTGRDLQQVYPARETPVGTLVRLEARAVATRSIEGLTFELYEGEIVGIAGLNGAGRTETLRALMGIDRLTAGELLLDGRPLRRPSILNAWRSGIAYVPEERRSQGLMLSQSVSENVALPHLHELSRFGLLNRRAEQETAELYGAQVRLKARSPQQKVRELSGGNQQKVVFARALAQPPRVLLLDEPTRGIDVGAKHDIYSLIRQISAAGTSIIMVSSDLPELLGMCDRALIISGGRMVAITPTAGLSEADLLTLCYGDLVHG